MSRLLPAVLLTAAAATLAAQQTPPTFRTGANYVRVDMYATRDGQVVDDLRADEVELLEDGAPQAIEAFEHVAIRRAGPQDTRIEPNSVEESRQAAADPRARVFVVFLDTLHTQIEGSSNMRLPLVRFLDRVLGPDDLVAVMTPEMSATDITFGRKTTVVAGIMENEWTWGRRGQLNTPDPKEQLYETCYPDRGDSAGIAAEMKGRRRERQTLDALSDLVVHLRGIREERKAVVTVTEGWRLYPENRKLAAVVQSQGVAPPPLPGPFSRGRESNDRTTGASGSMLAECEADRVQLSGLDHTLRLRYLTEDANRGNVTFYPVYARGLAAFDAPIGPERPPSIQQDRANLTAREDSLRELAANTDGVAVVATNQIDNALKRIVADLSSYYLLGYYSTNTRLDGRFRTITVRVKRPGVQVRARRGYRGLTAEQLLSATAGEKRAAAAAASPVGVVVNPRAPFRIRTATWGSANGGNAAVWVVGELDYATRRELIWSAGAKAEVTLVAGDGTEVVSSTVPVPATEGTFALRIPESGGVAPGDYALRVRVRPDSNPGLPVTDAARLTVPAASPRLGEPIMWRRGPSTGLKHLATADPRFQRSERIRFEMPTDAEGTASARMLDRVGNPLKVPVQVSERPDPSGQFRWIVADAVLAPLAAGDYGIEVTLGGTKQVASFKVVP
jgi:VWFA-related protein